MSQLEVTRTYLELSDPAALRPARLTEQRLHADRVRVERCEACPPAFYRFLYLEVGRRYHWRDRAEWSDDQIRARVADPAVSVWVMWVRGGPAGWFELQHHADGSVEIAYFGLLPEFIGTGLGKHLLTVATERAWHDGARRVWLHTCTLDDPAALPNYLRRGFTPFREERYTIPALRDTSIQQP